MKRSLLFSIIALFLFSAHTLVAQVGLGFRAGTQLSGVSFPDAIEDLGFNNYTSFSFAAVSNIKVNEQFSIQPELGFARKGFQFEQGIDIENIPVGATVRAKVNYIELPVLAKYEFSGGKVRPYLMAGPSINYAINGRLRTSVNAIINIPLTNTPIDLDDLSYERLEVGAIVGGGISIPTRNGAFGIDIRYQRGLTGINKIPIIRTNAHNRALGVNVGYIFNL